MSHSSGISVTQGLREAFGSAISGNTRLLKVQIQNESLVPVANKPSSRDFTSDLSLIPDLLDPTTPAYILFKTDGERPQFVLFFYVPAKSHVKDKTLYASSRSNLRQQLGNSYFIDEVFGDTASDFSVEGYQQHLSSKKAEAPLTEQEQIKKFENESGEIYSGGASTYVHGVAFPVDTAVNNAVKELLGGSLNYVQIAIDCDKERIILGKTERGVSLGSLKEKIPIDEPRFHLFGFSHEFDGSEVRSVVYIFSCPDGSKGTKSAPVRMRMLYSTSKANVAEIVKAAGSTIDAKLEINTGDEINEEELLTTLHPQKAEAKATFSKPARPGKGGARLIRKT